MKCEPNMEAYIQYTVVFVSLCLVFLTADGLSQYLADNGGYHLTRILIDSSCHSLLAGLVWLNTEIIEECYMSSKKSFHCNYWNTLWQSKGGFVIYNYGIELLLSLFFGSAVDIDHFLAAGSASLHAATNLQSRPWGHAFLTCMIVSIAIGIVVIAVQSIKSEYNVCNGPHAPINSNLSYRVYIGTRISFLVFSAYLVHLLRDAVRRGLWLCTVPYTDNSRTTSATMGRTYLSISTPPIPLWLVLLIYSILPFLNNWLLFVAKHSLLRRYVLQEGDIECGSESKLIV